jgi:hypothetical protein
MIMTVVASKPLGRLQALLHRGCERAPRPSHPPVVLQKASMHPYVKRDQERARFTRVHRPARINQRSLEHDLKQTELRSLVLELDRVDASSCAIMSDPGRELDAVTQV